jgi:hypothetical protein
MKSKTKKKKTEPVDHFSFFKSAVSETFSFLASDYEFKLASIEVYPPECVVKYQNDTTGIYVFYEWQSVLGVDLVRLGRTPSAVIVEELYSLDCLILERCPREPTSREYCEKKVWSEAHIEEVLRAYARTLRDCGRDILSGDFSIFPSLRKRKDEIIRRKTLELYGEDMVKELYGEDTADGV